MRIVLWGSDSGDLSPVSAVLVSAAPGLLLSLPKPLFLHLHRELIAPTLAGYCENYAKTCLQGALHIVDAQ